MILLKVNFCLDFITYSYLHTVWSVNEVLGLVVTVRSHEQNILHTLIFISCSPFPKTLVEIKIFIFSFNLKIVFIDNDRLEHF